MDSCRLPNYHEEALELLAKGIAKDSVLKRIKAMAFAHADPELVDKINSIIPEAEKVEILTESDKDELATLWSKVKDGLTPEVLNSSRDITDAIVQVLTVDEASRFTELMEKRGTKLQRRIEQRTAHIDFLKKLREVHVTLKDNDLVEQLDEDIALEEKRLERKEENAKALEERSEGLLEKERLFRDFIFITQTLDRDVVSLTEAEFTKELESLIEQVRIVKGKVTAYDAKLKQLQAAVKNGPRDKRRLAKETLDKFIKDNKEEYKANKKEFKKLEKEVNKLQAKELAANIRDRTGKKISERNNNTKKLLFTLEQELDKTQSRLMEMGLLGFASDAKNISMTTQQILANQSRLVVVAAEGANLRVNGFITEMEALGNDTITITQAEEAFGEFATKVVLQDRPKVTLMDGSTTDDLSGLNIDEIRKAAQIWKSQLISTYDGGFFSEDSALMTEEAFNLITAVATGTELVDGSTPEAVDPSFPRSKTQQEIVANTQLGTIPERNKFKTNQEAARALETSIRRLQTVFGFKYYSGFITEKVLRQVLHEKLMDIHPKVFDSAILKSKKPRLLSEVSAESRLATIKGVLQAHGANLNEMPEFNDPNWAANNSKLISFDIETFGKLGRHNDVSGIYCIQIHRYDSSNPSMTTKQTQILVNSPDKFGNPQLVDARSVPAIKRQPLTVDQITFVLSQLETDQNNGFKVITHNGNNFDFARIGSLVSDKNLLTRVALRSIDTLANITTMVPETTWAKKSAQPGKKLKELLKENLSERKETIGYDGRVRFTNSYPIDLTTDKPITLDSDGSGITTLWDEGNRTGDWYKFDAYAENDADLTIALYLHLANPMHSELVLRREGKTESRIIPKRPAVSNLWLNNEGLTDTFSTPLDSLGLLVNLSPELRSSFENTYMSEVIGYDAEVIYDTLVSWYLGVLLGDPKSNQSKLTQLVTGLRNRAAKESEVDSLLVNIADENQQAVKPQLEALFNTYGFVLKLNYSADRANTDIVTINDEEDGTLPTGELTRNADGKLLLYSNRTESPETYEQAVIDSFIQFIQQPKIKNRFFRALDRNVKPRERLSTETKEQYWTSVINDFLKEYIPNYTGIRQFGNSELDWKPADEVGMAIAQVIMDQKPGITVVDILVQRGETLQTLQTLDEQAAIKNRQGRSKLYGMPSRDKVHMAQPHELSKEERAYEDFRLKQRIRHVLRSDLSKGDRETLIKWLNTPKKQSANDPIASGIGKDALRILPDIAVRHPFSAIPDLQTKQKLIYEHLYQIPRLLMSFNHDCAYVGIKSLPRFISGEYPVYFLNDIMSAGGPTGSALLGGAIEQLAHMSSYGFVDAKGRQILEQVLDRGIELVTKYGPDVMFKSNKSDYKYNGKHNILAMLISMQEKSNDIWNQMLIELGTRDKDGNPVDIDSPNLIVKEVELGDPRLLLFDLIAGTSKSEGALVTIARNGGHNFDEDEVGYANSILKKLGKKGPDTIKNFLKGAVTPAFYQAGYPGILQGLTNKNEELGADGLTDDELEFLASIMTRTKSIVNGQRVDTIISKAIGITKAQRSALNKLLLDRSQVLSAKGKKDNLSSTLVSSKAAQKAKGRVERMASMEEWLNVSVRVMANNITRTKFGTDDISDTEKQEFISNLEKELQANYKSRFEEAAKLWDSQAIEEMSTKQYNDFVYNMNVAIAGGQEAAANHLMLWGLNRRAAVPHVLMDDAVDLHMLVMGVHIDKDDYVDYLNREIYFRYGIENASGRHHMVHWYGLGPESSKYAQPRVPETDKKEANPFGIWDVREMPKPDDRKFEDLFLRQVMLDLSRFYIPPTMNPNEESRTKYFQALEDRSEKELVASEISKRIDFASERRRFNVSGVSIDVAERNKRNKRAARSAFQRARMRTTLPLEGDTSKTLSLDNRVPGYGALAPLYSEIDFTQRGIYSLARAQHAMRVKNNRFNQILQTAKENTTIDPNSFVSSEFRGHESGYDKNHMPHIPMASTDIMGALSLAEASRQEQIAIRLQNVLTQFALTHGLTPLLKNKDWARIYYVMRLYNEALHPAISVLKKTDDNRETLKGLANEERLREARIKFFDGFVKTVGVSSVTLSGLKTFSTIDLMATFEERQLTLEDIENIKKNYGETPGWLQVLSYLAENDKIDRLMPLKFGLTIDVGVIAQGEEGRKKIKETSNLPITAFGREVLQLYHVILTSDIAKRVATEMIDRSEFATDKTILRDNAGFVVLESIDPKKNTKLYREIWKEIINRKQDLAVEMLTKFVFVLDSSNRLRLASKDHVVLREDESTISLTTQGPSDAFEQVKTLVDNPGTLWLYTPQMVIQLLNNLENYDLFADIELAIQTNSEIYGLKTKLDKIMEEEQAQLFENLRGDEEDINEALLFLHMTEPGSAKPKILNDYRNTNLAGLPKRIIDVGGYLRTTTQTRKTKTEEQEETIENAVTLEITVKDELGKIRTANLTVETADLPYFANILKVINYANKLGFTEQALELGNILISLYNESTNPPRGVRTTNYGIKIMSMMYEVFGNPEAEDNVYRFVTLNTKIDSKFRKLQTQIRKGVELMNTVMNNNPAETKREFYIATEMMERMKGLPEDLPSNPTFIQAVAAATGNMDLLKVQTSVRHAFNTLKEDPIEPEIANDEYAINTSPLIYTTPDGFINSFANPAHRAYATKLYDSLDHLVKTGIISQRAMDMKLMLIGNLSKYNPEIITNLGFELNTGSNGESIMSATKRAGRYTIGLNITAMQVTPENELIVKFAEELIHIARIKFIKTNSDEWKRITGIYSTDRSEGMIREMLMAMNNGKSYSQIENEVQYAMDNPDEFFAHMGVFFLLRETFGNADALHSLENRFQSVAAGLSIWRRAFYRIKGIAKRILNTFTKLRDDPAYSSLFLDAEEAVMSIIGKGLADRTDVENPDAHFNAFKNVSTTLDNKALNSMDMAKLQVLASERTKVSRELEVEQTKTPKDLTKITTLTQELRRLNAEIKAIDNITFMGKSGFEVAQDVEKIEQYTVDPTTGNVTRLTRRSLSQLGAQRSFLTTLVQRGVERRGERSDYGWTVAGAIRSLISEKNVSHRLQNQLLSSWNASSLTYNSPFAPMVVLAELIDATAVTTNGSFMSDVGGLENMKYAIDPQVMNIMRLWAELTSEFPYKKDKHLALLQEVVRYVHGTPLLTKDALEIQLVTSLGNAIKQFNTQLVGLMEESMMTDRAKSLDKFPLRLRSFELLTPEQRTTGYDTIKDKLRTKQLDSLNSNGQDSVFSSLLMYTTGILPFETGVMPPADSAFVTQVITDIRNGNPTIAKSGREAILNYYIRLAASNAVKHGSAGGTTILTSIDYVNTRSTVDIFKDVQDLLGQTLFKVRDGNVSFKDAFTGMSADNMNVLLESYKIALTTPFNEDIKRIWTSQVLGNKDLQDYFSIPNRRIPLLPDSFEAMEGADILAIDFLSRCGVSSHLFPVDSFHLNSSDVFGNTTASTDPILLQLFDTGVDSLFKSLARGTAYDAIERIQVQRVIGIPGAFFNITQILDMFEEEITAAGGRNVSNFYLLDGNGVRQHEDNKNALMMQSLQRLRLGLEEARGTVTRSDLELGSTWAWLNSAMKAAVLVRFGPNINTATYMVEGVQSEVAAMSAQNNIFKAFFEAIFLGKDMLVEGIHNKISGWKNFIGRDDQRKIKFYPFRNRKMRKLAANSLSTLDEITSPLLPQNLHATDPTSDVIEAMGFWDRWKLNRSRNNSQAMRTVRIAMDAAGNRFIMNMLRNGKLMKFRDAYRAYGKPFTSQGEIQEFLNKNKLGTFDLEVAIYIIRSGLLEGQQLEALDFARTHTGVWWNGVLLFQNLFDLEVELGNTAKPLPSTFTIPSGLTRKTLMDNINTGRASLAKFQDMNSTRGMTTRRALDAPRDDSIAANLIMFYKSYPTLFVAQQLLRRSTLSPLHKMAFTIVLGATLDFMYNVLLAVARGTLSFEDIEEKMRRRDKDWGEAIRYLIRHPIASNNVPGLLLNTAVAAGTGQAQGGILNSVGEAGIMQWGKDLWGLGDKLTKNETTWDKTTIQAYKVFGPMLGEIYSLPLRLAVMQAWGVAGPTRSGPKTGNANLETLYNIMVNSEDELGNYTLRKMFPEYPQVIAKLPKMDGIPLALQKKYLQQQQNLIPKPEPKPEPQPQQQPQQIEQPKITVPTKKKEPTIEEIANTPLTPPGFE